MKRIPLNGFIAPIVGCATFVAVRALAQKASPKYSAKVPAFITTPNNVQTRIGRLKLFDGAPDQETVQKVYDQLDFGRGVETFLAGKLLRKINALRLLNGRYGLLFGV